MAQLLEAGSNRSGLDWTRAELRAYGLPPKSRLVVFRPYLRSCGPPGPAITVDQRQIRPNPTSIALPGIALGQYAADWLEGKSVPQAMDILPKALTVQNIAQYESDTADPGSVFRDAKRRDEYLRMYGNICSDTRGQYLNFPWSSERR